MSFKPKTSKKINVENKSIMTLDFKHNEMIENIKMLQDMIPKLQNEKIELKHRKKVCDNIDEKLEISDRIKEITNMINEYKKKKITYYLDNSKYIFNYFQEKKDIVNDNNKKKMVDLFFFKNKKDNNTQLNSDNSYKYKCIKNNYTKQYLMNLDDEYIDINDFVENYERCRLCNGEFVLVEQDGMLVCNQCFQQVQYINDSEKPSYKEPPKEVSVYAYKRINHFREILAQFQAKESTKINKEVMDNIKKQIEKERITLDKLTNLKTKQILKNLGYNKYYEHIPFIKEKLGIKPPNMPIELENKLCNLFMEIQKPYAKFCPNDRVNFLSYHFVPYKLCELLGEDSYLPYFYMLKDPIKRMEQDNIWKKICNELNWEYIPTI